MCFELDLGHMLFGVPVYQYLYYQSFKIEPEPFMIETKLYDNIFYTF